jgi:hypothetical protein
MHDIQTYFSPWTTKKLLHVIKLINAVSNISIKLMSLYFIIDLSIHLFIYFWVAWGLNSGPHGC